MNLDLSLLDYTKKHEWDYKDGDTVFAYIKNWCHFSKAARDRLAGCKVQFYDVETESYCNVDFTPMKKDTKPMKYFNPPDGKVPQIFVFSNECKYIGGYSDLPTTPNNSLAKMSNLRF